MICNMITTGAMARLGYVYDDLMVNVRTKNSKLLERGVNVLMKAAETDRASALTALRVANMEVPVALVILKAGVSKSEAERRLKRAKGSVRTAIG
jgi:N-acetylmuramic acid 6-phosphate etherase